MRVDQISIVCQSHSAFVMIDNDGLGIKPVAFSRRPVSDVADSHVAFAQLIQDFRCKDIIDKSCVLVIIKDAVIVDYNAAALLSSVLQGKQTIICGAGYILCLIAKNAKDTAFFS